MKLKLAISVSLAFLISILAISAYYTSHRKESTTGKTFKRNTPSSPEVNGEAMTDAQLESQIILLTNRQESFRAISAALNGLKTGLEQQDFVNSFKTIYNNDQYFRKACGNELYDSVIKETYDNHDVAKISIILATLKAEIASQLLDLGNEKYERAFRKTL